MSRAHFSKSKRFFNVIPSTCYFHMKTEILTDFQICINVPLRVVTQNSATFPGKHP